MSFISKHPLSMEGSWGSSNSTPQSVLDNIPRFEECGPRFCHRNGHAVGFRSMVQCAVCRDSQYSTYSHALPCGHFLCGSCLSRVAMNIAERYSHNEERISYLLREAQAYRAHANDAQVFEPNTAAEYECRAILLEKKARELAGFNDCCGRDMRIEDWLPCMEPIAAKALYTTMRMMDMTKQGLVAARCGWPDCCMPVFSECWFQGGGLMRAHCIWCGGSTPQW